MPTTKSNGPAAKRRSTRSTLVDPSDEPPPPTITLPPPLEVQHNTYVSSPFNATNTGGGRKGKKRGAPSGADDSESTNLNHVTTTNDVQRRSASVLFMERQRQLWETCALPAGVVGELTHNNTQRDGAPLLPIPPKHKNRALRAALEAGLMDDVDGDTSVNHPPKKTQLSALTPPFVPKIPRRQLSLPRGSPGGDEPTPSTTTILQRTSEETDQRSFPTEVFEGNRDTFSRGTTPAALNALGPPPGLPHPPTHQPFDKTLFSRHRLESILDRNPAALPNSLSMYYRKEEKSIHHESTSATFTLTLAEGPDQCTTVKKEVANKLDEWYWEDIRPFLNQATDANNDGSSPEILIDLHFEDEGKDFHPLDCVANHTPRNLITLTEFQVALIASTLAASKTLDPFGAYKQLNLGDKTKSPACSASLEPVTHDAYGTTPHVSTTTHNSNNATLLSPNRQTRGLMSSGACPTIPISTLVIHTLLRVADSAANMHSWSSENRDLLVCRLRLDDYAPQWVLTASPTIIALALRQLTLDHIPPHDFRKDDVVASFLHPSQLAIWLSATGFSGLIPDGARDSHNSQYSVHDPNHTPGGGCAGGAFRANVVALLDELTTHIAVSSKEANQRQSDLRVATGYPAAGMATSKLMDSLNPSCAITMALLVTKGSDRDDHIEPNPTRLSTALTFLGLPQSFETTLLQLLSTVTASPGLSARRQIDLSLRLLAAASPFQLNLEYRINKDNVISPKHQTFTRAFLTAKYTLLNVTSRGFQPVDFFTRPTRSTPILYLASAVFTTSARMMLNEIYEADPRPYIKRYISELITLLGIPLIFTKPANLTSKPAMYELLATVIALDPHKSANTRYNAITLIRSVYRGHHDAIACDPQTIANIARVLASTLDLSSTSTDMLEATTGRLIEDAPRDSDAVSSDDDSASPLHSPPLEEDPGFNINALPRYHPQAPIIMETKKRSNPPPEEAPRPSASDALRARLTTAQNSGSRQVTGGTPPLLRHDTQFQDMLLSRTRRMTPKSRTGQEIERMSQPISANSLRLGDNILFPYTGLQNKPETYLDSHTLNWQDDSQPSDIFEHAHLVVFTVVSTCSMSADGGTIELRFRESMDPTLNEFLRVTPLQPLQLTNHLPLQLASIQTNLPTPPQNPTMVLLLQDNNPTVAPIPPAPVTSQQHYQHANNHNNVQRLSPSRSRQIQDYDYQQLAPQQQQQPRPTTTKPLPHDGGQKTVSFEFPPPPPQLLFPSYQQQQSQQQNLQPPYLQHLNFPLPLDNLQPTPPPSSRTTIYDVRGNLVPNAANNSKQQSAYSSNEAALNLVAPEFIRLANLGTPVAIPGKFADCVTSTLNTSKGSGWLHSYKSAKAVMCLNNPDTGKGQHLVNLIFHTTAESIRHTDLTPSDFMKNPKFTSFNNSYPYLIDALKLLASLLSAIHHPCIGDALQPLIARLDSDQHRLIHFSTEFMANLIFEALARVHPFILANICGDNESTHAEKCKKVADFITENLDDDHVKPTFEGNAKYLLIAKRNAQLGKLDHKSSEKPRRPRAPSPADTASDTDDDSVTPPPPAKKPKPNIKNTNNRKPSGGKGGGNAKTTTTKATTIAANPSATYTKVTLCFANVRFLLGITPRDCQTTGCTRSHPTIGNPAKKADVENAFTALLTRTPGDIPAHQAALNTHLKNKNPRFSN